MNQNNLSLDREVQVYRRKSLIHLNNTDLSSLSTGHFGSNVDKFLKCGLSKATKSPHSRSLGIKSNKSLQLMHSDLSPDVRDDRRVPLN